jgi:2Fe-2S ferredoxin
MENQGGTQEMVLIVFVEPNGERREIDARTDRSAMEAAIREGLDGIVAECGGQCNCGTCHVYVDGAWLAELPPPSETEDAMLDTVAAERRANSRLSCQICVTEHLAGLVLQVPDRQF